ncbi:MAG: 30S ribosomal protein S2 [Nanoarchaeota archaeon]
MTEEQQPQPTEELLIDSNEYLKSGIHIGTKFKNKYMANFIYKTRPDGLSVLNLKEIDRRIRLAVNMLSHYEPKDILIVSRRENGWKGLKKLHELTGIQVVTGRYPPGILTNTNLDTYWEPKVIFVCDPWTDKNTVQDAARMGIPVIALCDTNNQSNDVDLVVPCNNKGKKSVGLLFYIVTREFMRKKAMLRSDEEMPAKIEEFVEE